MGFGPLMQQVSTPIIELFAFRQAGNGIPVKTYMAEQVKVGVGGPVGVGVVVEAAPELMSILLLSV